MIKTTAPYQLPENKTLELVIESESISSSDYYDPTSNPESSNPVMAEERTHSRAQEQRPSRVPVQNVDVYVDVDEDEDEEEWHLDVNHYVSPYYTIQYYINAWSVHWHSYDNKRD
jgi:hypothetical protein